MILAGGKIYETAEQDRILDSLEEKINRTRAEKSLDIGKVTDVLDLMSRRLKNGELSHIVNDLGEDTRSYIDLGARLMSRENIEYKLNRELGSDFFKTVKTSPPDGGSEIYVRPMPLGTVLHIAAGNADVLPAFSVAEGLLTGNINILKLPRADSGITVRIFEELIKAEPSIADYIYIFDTPSEDVAAIKKMADMCDGISVWGGDEAVSAVRRFAPAGVKIIEWGHRLSFAYVSGYEDKSRELEALAEHIVSTKQLLCSSCQVIFIDSDSMEDVHSFCREFLPVLESAAEKYPGNDIGIAAQITLRQYFERLERAMAGKPDDKNKTYGEKQCRLTACADSALELSPMYGSCLVKRLPQKNMMNTLRKSKGYLQTAGLICSADKREALADMLMRCGVNRVTRAGDMSASFPGESHDGEYALRRFVRFANIQV